ncbi:MAG: hypothetical protein IJ326_07750 [Lachnospiraceae bacterium]|nr:hypothetical protein [Lachnospiraceae bacterium]
MDGKTDEIDITLQELIGEFLDEIKNNCKISKQIINTVLEVVNDEKFAMWFNEWIESSLKGFIYFEKVRALAKENEENVKNLVRASMENYVIRFDPNFRIKYEKYKMEKEEMSNFLNALDSVTTFYALNHLTRNAIKEDFANETGLGEEISDLYASLVDENYSIILMNSIADKLINNSKQK